ncbi:MAG: GNAT family N-acetyltransferase [Chitinophagaceae bacterium]|nr:GNAT family N-acetyltransferase [Chitinophagaceae bacterium]
MQKFYPEYGAKKMVIRTVYPKDLEKIQHIAQTVWPITYSSIMSQEQISYMLEKMYSTESLNRQIKDERTVFLLAEGGVGALGFVCYELNPVSINPVQLHKLYILPKAQGLGIGSEFLKIVCEVAKSNKREFLKLRVHSQNSKAIEFYKRNGFVIESAELAELGSGFSALDYIMKKCI